MPSGACGLIAANDLARLVSAVSIAAVIVCAWVPAAGADQNDPRLPALFKSLKATSDPEEGERIGRRITEIWNEHHNEGVSKIMKQGQKFFVQGHLGLALGNFTTVTTIEPNFAEAWNKRASVLFKMGELDAAARNAAETLAREPRHFLAMAGLGLIYLHMGRLEEALKAFDYALTINPHLSGTRIAADKLRIRLSH